MRYRNWRYDSGRAFIGRAAVPVVSVGNVTLGGTGKTPFVAWLARWFRCRDVRVSLISRGYGAEQGSHNDEARELEQQLPDVPHLQNADRLAAAQVAVEELETQLILLDDAFQHRRIARDLDIVLLDALEPSGFGHVFPRGALREPLTGLGRAHVIALSRANAVEPAERRRIRDLAKRFSPAALWIELAQSPIGLLNARGDRRPLETLAGKKLAAFCGIGNPAGFRHTLAQAQADVAAFKEFPDHHGYTRDDIAALAKWSAAAGVAELVCTHKDLVKLEVQHISNCPLWAVEIGLEIAEGKAAFEAILDRVAGTAKTIGAA